MLLMYDLYLVWDSELLANRKPRDTQTRAAPVPNKTAEVYIMMLEVNSSWVQ